MYGDNKTFQYIDGVATHWYYDQQIDPAVNYMVKSDKKDIFLIMTELCKLYCDRTCNYVD